MKFSSAATTLALIAVATALPVVKKDDALGGLVGGLENGLGDATGSLDSGLSDLLSQVVQGLGKILGVHGLGSD